MLAVHKEVQRAGCSRRGAACWLFTKRFSMLTVHEGVQHAGCSRRGAASASAHQHQCLSIRA
eukprot:1248833-Rhodomonas_salina.2